MPLLAPPDVVVIELPAQHAQAQAAVRSCEWVLGDGRCRGAGEAGPPATWRAVLLWTDADNLEARVEIQRQPAGVPSVQQRKFTSADTLAQRYSALGLVIVSHVVAASAGRTAVPTDVSPPRKEWGVDSALQFGPGLQADHYRWGLLLRGWMQPWVLPVQPLASLGFAHSSGVTQATWLEGALGFALNLELPYTLAIALRAEGVGQRVLLRAEQGQAAEEQALSRFGVRSGLELFAGVGDGFALFAAVQGSWLGPAYVVEVQGQRQGAERAPTWGSLAGVRFAF